VLIKHFIRDLAAEHGRPFMGITPEAMQLLVDATWPGNVRQLRNLVESMVVLAPDREIRPSDIPPDVREGGARLLPVKVHSVTRELGGKELEFILHSLLDLKLQVEDLRRRIDEEPSRVEVVEGWRRPVEARPLGEVWDVTPGTAAPGPEAEEEREESHPVLYESGMTMADVERAAIQAALEETRGNRRRAAERLGIGERTLYRKIREYGLA